jgi:hypothetical protein
MEWTGHRQANTTIKKTHILGKPYPYRFRPCYGSEELLLEFILDSSDTEFDHDLFTALKDIRPVIESIEDLWMNDEVLLSISSTQGAFVLSKDNWGFAFLMAEKNQPCLKLIDGMLNSNSLFEKEEVDFKNYENLNT